MSSKKSKKALLLADRLNFKPLINSAISKAIEIECPFSMDELISNNRKLELAIWRHAVLAAYAINSNQISEVGKMFNRTHATVIHSLRNTSDELDIGAENGIVDKIVTLYKCAVNYNLCENTTFNIQKYESRNIISQPNIGG